MYNNITQCMYKNVYLGIFLYPPISDESYDVAAKKWPVVPWSKYSADT